MSEIEWRDVAGWEGRYQVSNTGLVKGRRKIISPGVHAQGYYRVVLYAGATRKNESVHRLVCAAFHGPQPPDKPIVLHLDSNPTNNHAENLRWGTQSENVRQAVAENSHPNARKTHCKYGHEFTYENTYRYGPNKSKRRCIACTRRRAGVRPDYATHCPNGHLRADRTVTYGRKNTYNVCRACLKDRIERKKTT